MNIYWPYVVTQEIRKIQYMLHFPPCGDFCSLLITFANSLNPDQARQNIRPDLDPDCLILWWYVFLKDFFFETVNLKKNPQTTKKLIRKIKSWDDKKHAKLPSMQNYPACINMGIPCYIMVSEHSWIKTVPLQNFIFAISTLVNKFQSGNSKKGNWQTMQTQSRQTRMWHLIRVYTVCINYRNNYYGYKT